MPKFTLKIEAHNFPSIEVLRKVETLSDVTKLLMLGQKSLRNAARMFPAMKAAKIARISVRAY